LFGIHLRYKPGWTREQIAAADVKVAALNAATMRVSSVRRSAQSAARRYAREGHAIPPWCDVDHIHDLQLGGRDVVANMRPLDRSVNRSLGAQIHHRVKGLPIGTRIAWVTIGFWAPRLKQTSDNRLCCFDRVANGGPLLADF
jgi:filamentous hemagglutinin